MRTGIYLDTWDDSIDCGTIWQEHNLAMLNQSGNQLSPTHFTRLDDEIVDISIRVPIFQR